jgi:hypothetical protein
MALVQLIYVSSAARILTDADIRRILESSVRHNAESGVTGMLLFSSGNFLQVLEGDSVDVDAAWSKIAADDRHHEIIEISKDAIANRDFGTWSMGFHGVSASDAKKLPGYAPFFEHGFDAKAIGAKPGLALDLLRKFADSNG